MPSASTVFGDFDGMGLNAGRFQEVSDTQAGIMQNLGNVMDNLASQFTGQAATAFQSLGANLIAIGNRFSSTFSAQGEQMQRNVQLLDQSEQSNISIIRGVEGLTA